VTVAGGHSGIWRTLKETANPWEAAGAALVAQAAVSSENPEDPLATAKVERGASNQ
jgi:hypothetical protein